MAKVMLTRPLRNQASYVGRGSNKDEQGTTTLPTPPPLKGEGGGWGAPRRIVVENEKKENLASSVDLDGLVESLTPTLRKELLAKLALATQIATVDGSPRDQDMWAQAVYEALAQAQGAGGGGMPGPMVVKRSLASTGAWGSVSRFMASSKMDSLKVTERQSVYMMLAKLVVDQARYVSRESGIPMSPKLVGNCATNVAGIFEQSFPGYLGSGLALMVARRLTAH
jgi:hypothetical protein